MLTPFSKVPTPNGQALAGKAVKTVTGLFIAKGTVNYPSWHRAEDAVRWLRGELQIKPTIRLAAEVFRVNAPLVEEARERLERRERGKHHGNHGAERFRHRQHRRRGRCRAHLGIDRPTDTTDAAAHDGCGMNCALGRRSRGRRLSFSETQMSNQSPTFVATFADGEVTRMSIYHAEGCATFDLRRGIKLATAAYVSRARRRDTALGFDGAPVTVPTIVGGHFEDVGHEPAIVLAEYSEAQIMDENSAMTNSAIVADAAGDLLDHLAE